MTPRVESNGRCLTGRCKKLDASGLAGARDRIGDIIMGAVVARFLAGTLMVTPVGLTSLSPSTHFIHGSRAYGDVTPASDGVLDSFPPSGSEAVTRPESAPRANVRVKFPEEYSLGETNKDKDGKREKEDHSVRRGRMKACTFAAPARGRW